MIRGVFDFEARRRRFAEALAGAPAALPAARITYRSRDSQHVFRQDSGFYYLTGFTEPGAVAIFSGGRFFLFVEPRDPERETWDGEREGIEGAIRCGATAWPLEKLEAFLSDSFRDAERLFLPVGRDPRLDAWLHGFLAARKGSPAPEIADPALLLSEMRIIKDEGEIAAIEKAARISASAHAAAAEEIAPGRFEYEIQAWLEFHFRSRGAAGPAYPTIVASGGNATTLHYHRNDRRIEAGDLVLIDAGAEFGLYASDVTRTHAASGKRSREQEAVYGVVARAQEAGIAQCRAGKTFEEFQAATQEVLVRGLIELGVLAGSVEETLEKGAAKPYILHKPGHWLGLDVHDAGAYRIAGKSRAFVPGMVLTVEPGLYFRAGVPAPRGFSGIGVRIEDDVLVTRDGPRVLSTPS
jgi:Xaa-Pro aminopeptidase